MNTGILLLGIILTSYLARYNKLQSVRYDQLLVNTKNETIINKRILVLGNDLHLYSKNSLATSFFNWPLSKEVFEHPEYYENIIEVYRDIKNDPPQYIIDNNQTMESFFSKSTVNITKELQKAIQALNFDQTQKIYWNQNECIFLENFFRSPSEER